MIQNNLIRMDRFLDTYSILSTVNNIVDLFIKCVVLPCMNQATIDKNHYFTHLSSKSFQCCLRAIAPILWTVSDKPCCTLNDKHCCTLNDKPSDKH